MKKFLLILFACAFLLPASALQPVGKWEVYATFRTPKQICEGGDKVFFLADNSLFSYGKNDKEIRELSRLNILSDNNIILIAKSDNDLLVVVYNNSNIDLIDMNTEKTHNLPYIKNASITASKTVNDISFFGDETYLATDFGIVVLNNDRKEIKTTYTFNEKIYTAARQGDYLYCIRADRKLYRCRVDGIPYDINSWEETQNSYIKKLRPFGEGLLMLHDNDNLYYLTENSENATLFLPENKTKKIETQDNRLLIYTHDKQVYFYDEDLQPTTVLSLDNIGYEPVDVSCSNDQNRLWIIESESVVSLKYDRSSVLSQETEIPCNIYQKVYNPFSLTIANGRVYVSPAGVGYLNDEQDIDGYISILENGKWTNILPEGIPVSKHPSITWGNLYNIAVDPDDKETFYVGTWLEGLYRFKNNQYDTHWNDENSTIGNASDWAYKAGFIAFDKRKNLYVLNLNTECGLSVMQRNGTWYQLAYNDLKSQRNLTQIFIPEKSSANWITCPAYNSFVFAFEENGTESISDDKTRKFTTFTDQNGESIDGNIFYEIAEDHDGKLWIATNRGPIVIANPDNFANSNFTCNRIKIARNDGTNLADYLLNDETIQAIAIDGADRKWFGTKNSGAYLVSKDGQETIYHFTSDNSPLPSDNIYDIAVHPETGEVFFATESGLVSFRAEATEPKDDYSDVYVFPNPVRPDYEGNITVTGLQENSLVKITDTAGNIIYQNFSTGGQLVWNGLTRSGDRLRSGIYLVFASVDNGGEGVVAKFAVVR